MLQLVIPEQALLESVACFGGVAVVAMIVITFGGLAGEERLVSGLLQLCEQICPAVLVADGVVHRVGEVEHYRHTEVEQDEQQPFPGLRRQGRKT
jgi:hypothetical protein